MGSFSTACMENKQILKLPNLMKSDEIESVSKYKEEI